MGLIEDIVSAGEQLVSDVSGVVTPTISSSYSFTPISLPTYDWSSFTGLNLDLEFDLPQVIAPIVDPIQETIIDPIQEILPPVLDTQIDVIPQVDLSGVTSQLTNLSDQMINLQSQIESIEFGITGLETQVSSGFTDLGSQITSSFAGLTEQITSGFSGVSEMFSSLGTQISSSFAGLTEQITSGFAGLGEQITGGIASLTEFLTGGFEGLAGMLPGALGGDILKWVLIIGGVAVAGIAIFYLVKVFILKKGLSSGLNIFKMNKNPSIKLPGDIKINI